MERLTEWNEYGYAFFTKCFEEPCGGCGCARDDRAFLAQVCEKLAQYEDTGLEPEKVTFLASIVNDAFSDDPGFTEHLRDLVQAEKDGRLVELPCKVGDTVYRIYDDCDFPGDCHAKRMCKGCEYRNLFIEEQAFCLSMLSQNGTLGHPYYLTREEAEAALEKEEHNGRVHRAGWYHH